MHHAVADALRVAARADLARAARRERAGGDVGIERFGKIVDRLDLVGVGRLGDKVHERSPERGALPDGLVERIPRVGFGVGRRPHLDEDVARRRRAAADRDCAGELRERRAGVVEGERGDRIRGLRELRHRPRREERRCRGLVVVGLHPVGARREGADAHFIHVAPERTLAAGEAAADGQRRRTLLLEVGQVTAGHALTVGVEGIDAAVGASGLRICGIVVGIDGIDLRPLVLHERENLAGDAQTAASILIFRFRRPNAHVRAIGAQLQVPGLGRRPGLAADNGVVTDAGIRRGHIPQRPHPERHDEVDAERVQRGDFRPLRRLDLHALVFLFALGRDRARGADLADRNRERHVGSERRERIVRGVVDRNPRVAAFAEVPDADVVRERVGRADVHLALLGRAVEHRELGAVLHRRELHPDQRLARRVPRVDLERERRAVLRDEADVVAGRLEHQVVVVEPGDAGFRDAHEHGEARQRRAAGVVAGDREDDAAREAIGLDCLEVGDRGHGEERREEKRDECKAYGFHHSISFYMLNVF